jgi:hypothetical protein
MKISLSVKQLRSLAITLNTLADNVDALPCNYQIPLEEGNQGHILLEFDDSTSGVWYVIKATKQT